MDQLAQKVAARVTADDSSDVRQDFRSLHTSITNAEADFKAGRYEQANKTLEYMVGTFMPTMIRQLKNLEKTGRD